MKDARPADVSAHQEHMQAAAQSVVLTMPLRNAPENLRISATIALIDSQQREMDERSRPQTAWRAYLEDAE